MNNFHKTIALTLLLASMITSSSYASSLVSTLPVSKEGKLSSVDAQKLINRLEEIKSMDVKNLSRKERKELRHEVRSIQKVQSTGNGGVYLSVGAIIIIILLLILIL
jgi:biopolymer transport protein ExbD